MVRRISFIAIWVVAAIAATGVVFAAVRSVADGVVESPGPTLSAALVLDETTVPSGGDETSTTDGGSGESSPSAAEPFPEEDGQPIRGADTSSSTSSPSTSSSSTSTSSSPSTSSPSSSSTSTTEVTSTSSPSSSSSSTSTSQPDDDTTSQPPTPTKKKTYQLVGGGVRITYGNGTVKLDGAGPKAGFSMEVDKNGPDEVRVEFESDDHDSEIRVRWKDGGLREEIEEDD